MAGSSRNQLKNIATSSSHPLNAVAKAATRQLGKAIAGEQKSGRRVTKKYITEGQKEVRADIRRQAERPAFGIRTKRVTDRDQKRRLAQRFPIPAMRSDAPSLKALELPHGRTVNVKRHGKPKRSTVVRFRDREYGRHIFIYNHLTTNQVVYSFTEELQESSLEQLTFVGKKSVPSELRPDMWSCLAVVTFPTQHQGREAFRQLREFRMMHEYCWEKPEQGASLPKKSERVRMLQNQKANSIADLAAVLELQNKKGEEQREDWKAFWEEQDKRVAKLERIAGGLLQPKLEGREKLIEGLKRRRGRETENQQLRTDEQIKRLEKEKAALQAQISNAKRELARRKAVEDRVQMTVSEEAEALEVGKSEEPGMFIRQMLRHKKLAELVTRYRPLPKRGPERIRTLRELHPERVPVLWMEGVHVLWADASDADYAESWPEEMEHGEMGYMYRKASHPEAIRNIWRKERTGALLAKKSEGKQLTKEEEEFMKNVQLDGEDSGQGEDDGKRNEKRKAPDSEKEKTEMEKRRQEEEKKSIWSRIGGMFSGSKPQDRASV